MSDMRPGPFSFHRPAERIAKRPLPQRADARLLVVPTGAALAHRTMRDLPGLLRQGDVLVVNDTTVIPARLQDSWDVEVSTTGALAGCRVYRYSSPPAATWPTNPGNDAQISQFPFKISNYQSAISAASMTTTSTQRVADWQVKPLFSILLPPKTRTNFVTDRDNNVMNDQWEKHYFGGVTPSPVVDSDNDGFSNLFEFLAGTSPVDAADFIRQSLVASVGGGLQLEWTSLENRSYVVEFSGNLTDWAFSETITATANTCSHPVSRPVSGPLFVRIRTSTDVGRFGRPSWLARLGHRSFVR